MRYGVRTLQSPLNAFLTQAYLMHIPYTYTVCIGRYAYAYVIESGGVVTMLNARRTRGVKLISGEQKEKDLFIYLGRYLRYLSFFAV